MLMMDKKPLNVVQEKAKLERSVSQRAAATSGQTIQPPTRRQQNVNLFDDDHTEVPPRPSTTDRKSTRLNSSHSDLSRMPSSA